MTSSPSPANDSAGLRALFDAQHQASRAQIEVPLAVRRDRLLRIRVLLDEHGAELAQAVNADFGVRSPSSPKSPTSLCCARCCPARSNTCRSG
jgi:coniferyl-aldehyde dehydrogenase